MDEDRLFKTRLCVLAIIAGLKLYKVCEYDTDEEEDCRPRKKVKPNPATDYIERAIPNYTQRQFQEHFRISRQTFELLLPIIHNHLASDLVIGRPRMDTTKILLATLWILATPDSYRSVSERFDLSKGSLNKGVARVVRTLNNLASRYITWPSNDDRTAISESFYQYGGIDNIIGAIDGTFISIKAPLEDPDVYVTKKYNYAITLQAVAVPTLAFTDCYVGYPGSVSDTRIFYNSDLYQNVFANENHYFSHEQFIVGDEAYPALKWCMPPYVDRGNINAAQTNFNLQISQSRQVIERAFALLFGRFRRLKYLDMNRTDFIPATVLACCVLHNICLHNCNEHIDDYIREGVENVNGNDLVQQELLREGIVIEGQQKRDAICGQLYEMQ